MREKISEIVTMIAPEIHHKYIHINKKVETVIYVKALNTIFGMIKAALLIHKVFGELTTIVIKLNPYELIKYRLVYGTRVMYD